MINKNITIFLVLIVVVSLTVLIVSAEINKQPVETYVEISEEMLRVINESESIIATMRRIDPDLIAAYVNDEPIYLREIAMLKLLYQGSRKVTLEQMLEHEMKNRLYFVEAKKRGLLVNIEEANEYVKQVRSKLKESMDSSNDNIRQRALLDLQLLDIQLRSLNMTEEEYWEKAPHVYQKLLTIGRLRGQYYDEKEQVYDERKYEDLYNKLKEEANIDIRVKLDDFVF